MLSRKLLQVKIGPWFFQGATHVLYYLSLQRASIVTKDFQNLNLPENLRPKKFSIHNQ